MSAKSTTSAYRDSAEERSRTSTPLAGHCGLNAACLPFHHLGEFRRVQPGDRTLRNLLVEEACSPAHSPHDSWDCWESNPAGGLIRTARSTGPSSPVRLYVKSCCHFVGRGGVEPRVVAVCLGAAPPLWVLISLPKQGASPRNRTARASRQPVYSRSPIHTGLAMRVLEPETTKAASVSRAASSNHQSWGLPRRHVPDFLLVAERLRESHGANGIGSGSATRARIPGHEGLGPPCGYRMQAS